MDIFNLSGINWLAVLVAGVASFMLGGLWYAALFGKAWARIYGITEEQIKAMPISPAVMYTIFIVCDLLLAAGMALVLNITDAASLTSGLTLGAVVGALVLAPLTLTTHLASDRPPAGFAIDFGKQFCSLLLVGAILGAWR